MLVVIIEDDDAIAEPLAKGLTREGYDVERFERGEPALHRLQVDDADPAPAVVLLDLGLPDVDGFELCRRLRAESDVPIIVVTARGEEVGPGRGARAGRRRLHREAVRLSRARRAHPCGDSSTTARRRRVASVRVGDLEIDRANAAGDARRRGDPLTPKEFDLLALLADDPGAVWSRHAHPRARSGTRTGTAPRRPSTCTWRRCARSSVTRAGSRRSEASGSGCARRSRGAVACDGASCSAT